MIRIAIFASGSGTNAENIINYFNNINDVEVNLILSNKKDAFVLNRAKKFNIRTFIFNAQTLKDTNLVLDELLNHETDWIILAGFLLKIPQNLLNNYKNKIINIHPALLPKYGGKGMYGNHVHNAVIKAGEKESGISIHLVNEIYDAGEIIFQAKVNISTNDTPESLATKIHQLEYEYFPKIIHHQLSNSNHLA